VVAVIKGYCESFFSSEIGFVPSQIIALVSPTTRPLRERQMQVGTSLFLVRFGFFLLCVRRGGGGTELFVFFEIHQLLLFFAETS
jgi:hypothetical protein